MVESQAPKEGAADNQVLEAKQAVRACATPDCGKPATMQCPTCLKLGLEPTFFCGQECFTNFWKFHKLSHKKPEARDDGGIYTGPMRPFPYSFKGHREVPAHIKRPDYAKSGQPNAAFQRLKDKVIPVVQGDEVDKIRMACRIGREALDVGHAMVKPGVTTEEIDKAIHDFLISKNAYPSTLNYYNYPRSCCTSVNEIICHGIPDSRPLEEGDIINIDVTAYYEGFHGDLNETYFVGKVSESSRKLVRATYDALQLAIAACKPNVMYREMGNIISNHVEPLGYSVVRSYTGHGIGSIFH